jgi:general secretion pathway protein I
VKFRGFTLIEVLVALVIVAFGISAVLTTLSSAATNTGHLREKSLAEWIGFNEISTMRLALQAPAAGTSAGDLDYASGKWHWSQEVTELADTPGILKIIVKVRRADGAASTVSDDKADWLATVAGFRGDAISAASGELPDWNGVPPGQGAGARQQNNTNNNGNGNPAGNGTTPPANGTTPPANGNNGGFP